MYYQKLILLSVFMSVPVLHAMDFHQKAVERDQKGFDVRAVVPLRDQNATLPCGGQNKSVNELFNDDTSYTDNPLSAAMLYIFEQGKVAARGSVIDCVDKKQLLELYVKGLYVVYTKRGKTLPVLLLGTSNVKDIELLTTYLVGKSSHTKENEVSGHHNTRLSMSSQPVLAELASGQNRNEERAV